MTEFAIPTANSLPWGITAGPDGNLWFEEQGALQVGRLSLAAAPTPTAPPTPTVTVPPAMPSVTPPVGQGPSQAVPALSPRALALLGAGLVAAALFLLRRVS